MAFGMDWIELNEPREIIKNALAYYMKKLAHFSESKNFQEQFGGVGLVPLIDDQVNEKVKNLDNLIQLFENPDYLKIHEGLNDITWPIVRDAVVLYNNDFEKSENFAKEELKVIIPKSRLEKYKNVLKILSEEMTKNIPTDN